MKIKSKDITINKYPRSDYAKKRKAKKLYHSYNPSINDPIENKENKMTFMQNLCRSIHNLMGFMIVVAPFIIMVIGVPFGFFGIFEVFSFGFLWALFSCFGILIFYPFQCLITSIWEYEKFDDNDSNLTFFI